MSSWHCRPSRMPAWYRRISKALCGCRWGGLDLESHRASLSKAKQVLDYYHCSEHLHELASAQYGRNTQGHGMGCRLPSASLLQAKSAVVPTLKNEACLSGSGNHQQTTAYLKKHRSASITVNRRGGFHMGSGAIESANKLISHVRLKRPGAWWYPSNANNILKLRCAKYNGSYGKIMQLHRRNDRKRRAETREHGSTQTECTT